ncbi:MAG: SBBP repeat-containing protein [Candidatus Glassbacteria bacterium]
METERPVLEEVLSIHNFNYNGQKQVSEEWVSVYDGTAQDYDRSNSVALDTSGNVYVTGYSHGGGSFFDCTTIKYDRYGNELWVVTYNGPGNYSDRASDIQVDDESNVYITGGSYSNETDFDFVTIKYDKNGNELWVARYDGPGSGYDFASSLAVDELGNVYISGYAWNGEDPDYTTIKYDENGNELWIAVYDGPINGSDYAEILARDPEGNIYVTGRSPGAGTLTDFATIKYDPDGNELWVMRFDGPGGRTDFPTGMDVDTSGCVYVTGYTYSIQSKWDYATVKYETDGSELWRHTHNGPANGNDYARAVTVDQEGNAYVTGSVNTNWIYHDYATIKYDTDGNELWISYYDGSTQGAETPNAIALDAEGNIYVTGDSRGTGIGSDFATVKYDTEGNEEWVIRYNGEADDNDHVEAMALDENGNLYLTGHSWNGISNDYVTIKYNQRKPCHKIPVRF